MESTSQMRPVSITLWIEMVSYKQSVNFSCLQKSSVQTQREKKPQTFSTRNCEQGPKLSWSRNTQMAYKTFFWVKHFIQVAVSENLQQCVSSNKQRNTRSTIMILPSVKILLKTTYTGGSVTAQVQIPDDESHDVTSVRYSDDAMP